MATGARVIQIYKKATNKKQSDLICENYSCLDNIIKADVNELILLIIDDKASKRREENGGLGVRVQSTGHYSNPMPDQAEAEIFTDILVTNSSIFQPIHRNILWASRMP